ncbi:hypothetical protein FRC19_009401 [Serendipita sp. 401]|nr:hypothetical protein FRC19_009401 [Serendipita sp. 401]KAG9055970.1 hypothetical protein FS842_000645 [Serendipita sp. 407]
MRLKGEFCMGLASVFSFVALILLIMVNVGQINPGKASRSISMVNMNISMFGTALQAATGDPPNGLFNSANWTISQNQGLQSIYSWGLYAVCGYNVTERVQGGCSNSSLAHPFTPFDVIVGDTPARFNTPVTYFISNSEGVEKFVNSGYFKTLTHVAFYLLFIATIATGAAFVIGLFKSTVTFVLSTLLVIISAIFVLVSSVLWSTVIKQARTINDVRTNQNLSIGIVIHQGNALYMLWAVFALLVVSTIPYTASCRTFRRR